jgi:hypothetical protein
MTTKKSLFKFPATRPDRICGECDVCCTAMRVAELEKPAGTRCVHMRESGCGRYQNRPSACRDWYCMWLRDNRGIFSESERPDRVGIFLTASKPTEQGDQVAFAHPVRADAMANPAAMALVRRLRQYVPVRVLPYCGETASLTHEGAPLPSAA